MVTSRPTQRLYLFTPPLGDPTAFLPDLDAALGAGDIAAVLLRLAPADEGTLIARAKTVAAAVQRRDVAVLFDGHADLVARSGADGAHLTGVDAFAAALALLKPERIAGAGGLRSRHDAMLAGETGADYVMFGEPFAPPSRAAEDKGEDKGGSRRPPLEETLDRLEWWAHLVEIPCVGYAASRDEVAALAQTGADFIALGDWIWTEPQDAGKGAAAAVAAAAEHLA
jgi:thiamine-phosphate pyrophosphorylase